MLFLGANEFKCLSNAVDQACIRNCLPVSVACAPVVRKIVRTHQVKIHTIKHVLLHQVPTHQGRVDYLLEVFTVDGTVWCESFQKSGINEPVANFVLYDRQRDGVVEYLHLQH